MRLFIRECKHCRNRIYLNVTASTRKHLAERIGGSEFEIQCSHCAQYTYYTINDVFAEQSVSATPAGAIIGGLVGLIGGPLGMLIGGVFGTLWGANADEKERRIVNRFNRSG